MKKFMLAMMFCVAGSVSASAEDFESLTVGDQPPAPFDLVGGMTVRDSATIAPFGPSNQYLETIGGPGLVPPNDPDAWRFNRNNGLTGAIATTSFDFYWDKANNDLAGGNDNSWFRMALRANDGTSDGTVNFLDVGTGAGRQIRVGDSNEPGIDFDFNTAVRFDIVYNMSGSEISYNEGATLANHAYDVWIDGVIAEDDFGFNRLNNLANPTNAVYQGLWHNNGDANGGQNGLAYYDNFDTATEAVVTFGMDPPGVLGDFDGDLDVDLADLDEYNGNIGASVPPALAALDLDGDLTVGANDFETHYTTLVQTSNGQTGTFAGDANLDGVVDVLADAAAVVNNLGVAATSWSQGDFDGNGTVDVLGDAAALINNLGMSNVPAGSVSTSAVPEPGSLSVLVLSGLVAVMRRKR